jgi:hypothetical protein
VWIEMKASEMSFQKAVDSVMVCRKYLKGQGDNLLVHIILLGLLHETVLFRLVT